MPWARVAQRRISVADSTSRTPEPHFYGERVQLNEKDYKRLLDAGAVVSDEEGLPEDAESLAPGEGEQAPLNPGETEELVGRLTKRTVEELEGLASEYGMVLPEGTKKEKAEYLIERGVTGG